MLKKILVCGALLSVFLVSSALAAEDINMMGGRWGLGLFGTTPTLRVNFMDNFAAQLGVDYVGPSSNNSGAPAVMNDLLWLSFKGPSMGMNAMNWGILMRYNGNLANNAQDNSVNFGLTWGFETLVNPNLVAGFALIPVQYTSTTNSGFNTTSIAVLNEAQVYGHLVM